MPNDIEAVMDCADRIERRVSRKAAEINRVAVAKAQMAKSRKKQVRDVVIETAGSRHTGRRVDTTCSKMVAAGTLPKYLMVALDGFTLLVADSFGVATLDGDDATSNLTGGYEPGIGRLPRGPRTVSDRQLRGLGVLKAMQQRVPAELQAVFRQIVTEEVGAMANPKSLAELGEEIGRKHKQASAAGGTLVYCVLALIHQFMKERGY
ncbi:MULTISPECIES: hypothetical protein [Rhodomicrobium]|uniref:hypothetical protein n=1 Tax=Rhodomicrobium TaxID=1068 RepID=UPI000B4A5EAE|nr:MULTISPECIES: hypothetical protein [Rhodomicrobium]